MPCYDSRNEPSYVAAETRKESQAYIDKLTRLLCEAYNKMSTSAIPSDELSTWGEEHNKVDRRRAKAKQKK